MTRRLALTCSPSPRVSIAVKLLNVTSEAPITTAPVCGALTTRPLTTDTNSTVPVEPVHSGGGAESDGQPRIEIPSPKLRVDGAVTHSIVGFSSVTCEAAPCTRMP